MIAIFHKIDTAIEKFCWGTLVIAVAGMLLLTLVNIVLRWLGMSFLWIEPFVRHLVFMAAFLGGSIATGKNSHIGVDIISKILEVRGAERALAVIRRFILAFSLVVVIALTCAGVQFALQEYQFGAESFLGIHSSALVSIIPVGFALIAYRLFYQLILSLQPGHEPHTES